MNSSRSRFGTSRPCASVTVVMTGTIRVLERNVGSCVYVADGREHKNAGNQERTHMNELSNDCSTE